MNIRSATEQDLKQINDIYNYYVIKTTSTCQEIEETLGDRIKWFHKHINDNFPVIVAEIDGKILGWGSLYKFQERSAYRFCVENSIYLDPNYLRSGIGTALMRALIENAKHNGYKAIVAKISGEQETSIAFHERFGFQRVGYLKNIAFKFNRWYSMTLMQINIK